jgi:hypothetical protein
VFHFLLKVQGTRLVNGSQLERESRSKSVTILMQPTIFVRRLVEIAVMIVLTIQVENSQIFTRLE